ncbi:hypothetical protein [Roseibium aggregatum]|uniref:hypothetical protein n=1 Tax=Roseibium aggregatum TaxID=187304 RepID=UPI001E3734CE|nr:hypothetical protein [Roseibium aggregatum]
MTKSILCAVDVQQVDDTKVLETADKLARLDGAQLDVITVVPSAGINLVASYFDENFQGQMVRKPRKSWSRRFQASSERKETAKSGIWSPPAPFTRKS